MKCLSLSPYHRYVTNVSNARHLQPIILQKSYWIIQILWDYHDIKGKQEKISMELPYKLMLHELIIRILLCTSIVRGYLLPVHWTCYFFDMNELRVKSILQYQSFNYRS